jgi:hypothetical protein
MSVQLIVFPQYFNGSSPLLSPSTEFFVDGNYFIAVNTSSSTLSVTGSLPQAFIDTNTYFGYSLFTSNIWYRFSNDTYTVENDNGDLEFSAQEGIVQRLSSLTVGATYDITVNVTTLVLPNLKLYHYTGNVLNSTYTFTSTGIHTFSILANTDADVIVIFSENTTAKISNISCILSTSTPSGVFTDLSNGQVICDLYEDEDIPLSLSVDDFKNVAEKVQSYSKAFNLPATKRNNQIFDNIFEVTRTDTGLNFNPYKKTKAILKQDGLLLFEGYLRMIDISDKSGEISYNVNLYSEVVALADVLGDKTFSELDFTELEHEYNKTNIINSWNDTGSSITYSNPDTSGYRDDYTTLRYPFVDWTHQILIGGSTGTNATVGNPEYTALEQIFRPFINIKYLIDRIFQAVPFTYESAFFDTDDFKKLYMDFNWGEAGSGAVDGFIKATEADETVTYGSTQKTIECDATADGVNPNGSTIIASDYFDVTTNTFTSIADNTFVIVSAYISVLSMSTNCKSVMVSLHKNGSQNASTSQTWCIGNTINISLGWGINVNAGDTLEVKIKSSSSNVTISSDSFVKFTILSYNINVNSSLLALRGELGQWDFLKGLLTMFNLVTLPDENNPSNIIFEPYNDVFIPTATAGDSLADRGITHDWTEKIDVSEMKLMPLTDLNKKTIFKFVEDEDDFPFMNYKRQAGGHLYGSKKYNASEFTILAGEDEIIAEPFAATVVKPLETIYPDFITPSLYSYNSEDGTSEGFDNSPRIMYNNGIKSTGASYYIPAQNGGTSANETNFLQFSHLTNVPTITGTRDFHFGECQLLAAGAPSNNNLFNLYWLPYYSELYNPDTRIMTIKVNLSPSDISGFKFNDTVFIKNRTFRVNKIDYKPNDLATVEFILIP